MIRWSILARLCVVLALASSACGSPDRGAVDPGFAGAPLAWVGGGRCADCHATEYELWRGSHHDLAMQEGTAESVLGDFDAAELHHGGVSTRFFRRGDDFMVETEGPTGELAEFRIAYTYGVEPLQQYLIELPGGRLQALSICWDTRPAEAGGQRWFHLYPGERIPHDDPLHWTGPLQNWNFMCAECHSTGVRKNYDLASDSYATSWSEIDVSCEACHGPGSRHVAWVEARERGEAVDDQGSLGLAVVLKDRDRAAWIIDPVTGIAARTPPRTSRTQFETCARCHSRRSVLREQYAHGRPLADTHRPALLAEPLYYDDGQILEEVYVYGSFLQSKMYAAGVACSDCHDPHSAELTRGEAEASCTRCHLADRFADRGHHFHEPGTAGASCVECHMPSRDYMVVDSRRDHSFRIPTPELSVELGTPNACNGCHRDRTAGWATAAVEAWYGPDRRRAPIYPRALHAARVGAVDAESLLITAATDPSEPAIARASAAALLRGYWSPRSIAALGRAAVDEDPLVRAAAVSAIESWPTELRLEIGAPALDDPVRLVRIEAARSLASLPPESLEQPRRDALVAGLEEARAEQRANLERPEAHVSLGTLEALLGDVDAAESAFRRALAIDSGHLPAYVNLADLYRTVGRDPEGERLLRAAIASAPEAAALHHALGLLLVRRQQTDEALAELARAAALAPDEARYAYVYGVALHSSGEAAHALEILDAAHRRWPGDRELLQALATIARDAGARTRALGYARALAALSPDDPGARRLVAQLESTADGQPLRR